LQPPTFYDATPLYFWHKKLQPLAFSTFGIATPLIDDLIYVVKNDTKNKANSLLSGIEPCYFGHFGPKNEKIVTDFSYHNSSSFMVE